jgi:hypothetical protein
VQPRSQIWALGLSSNINYVDDFLSGLKARGGLHFVDAITIHGYPRNPDDTSNLDRLRAVIEKHGAKIAMRQGETGAPSRFQERAALRNIQWTETTQVKWNLRRMLAHRSRDIPMNLFTLSDMTYRPASEGVYVNHKGLLATKPDLSVAHVKPAYLAAQVVFSIFDDTLQRLPTYGYSATALREVALSGYRRGGDHSQLAAYWYCDAPPSEANGVDRIRLTLPDGRFSEPVIVDLRTAEVRSIPREAWTQNETGAVFRDLPAYDSPMIIAERALLSIRPVRP